MPTNRLPSWKVEILVTFIGVIALVTAALLYDQAFPSAAVDLKISRDEITRRSETYVRSLGFQVDVYESALTFNEAFWGSIYLQRTLGISETNRRIRTENLPIYYWHMRWFKPLQKEEFSVDLAPTGEVVAFSHTILENAPGGKLSQDEARTLAEKYLTQDRRWNLADWERVSASTEEKLGGRVDHHFGWKRRDFVAGESEMRLLVDVQGEQLGSYDWWIKVPESFERNFRETQSRAGFFGDVSYYIGFFGFGAVLLGAAFFAVVRGVKIPPVGYAFGLLVGGMALASMLNSLPLSKSYYGTTQDYAVFWIVELVGIAFATFALTMFVPVMWVGGQQLSRRVWRYQDKILPRGADRWTILARSTWRGLMLGGMMGGYVVVFYLIATRFFSSWTPLETQYTDLYATPFPFLAPLLVGIVPAALEEMVFRITGVSAVLFLTRNRVLALLIPGALWAFAHLGYITDPAYLRGIELTIAAIFLEGLFFYFFDLTTTMVAHFAYNTMLGTFPLLRSSDPYFFVSGLIVIAIMLTPIVPGLVRGILRRLRGVQLSTADAQARVTTLDDAPALTALAIDVRDWRAWLGDVSNRAMCLCAGDEIIGVATGCLKADNVAEIQAVYVAPAWRRRYYGTWLVDQFIDCLKMQGAVRVESLVEIANRPVHAFWSSQGWRTTARLMLRVLTPAPRLPFRQKIKQWMEVLANLPY